MFTGAAPKLENFLGGGPTTASSPNSNNNNQFNGVDQTAVTEADELCQLEAPPSAVAPVSSKKTVDTFGQRTSIYRGVTRHRWTGRYEAHLWDNSCRREGQSRKGRQGGYDKEEKAARAYDLAALKYWGPTTTTNFAVSNYEKELEDMTNMTRQEFVASLRRKSSGFSRGASIYRGVTRHHQHGRWQARIGRVAGNKDLYLGTFSTQEEAAEAYDIAAIKFRGLNAVTNFDMSRYDVKSIANSNLPVGGMSNNTKLSKTSPERAIDNLSSPASSLVAFSSSATNNNNNTTPQQQQQQQQQISSNLSFTLPIKQDLTTTTTSSTDYWSNIFGFQNPNPSSTTSTTPSLLLGHNSHNLSATTTNATTTTTTTSNGGYYGNFIESISNNNNNNTNLGYGSGLSSWISNSNHNINGGSSNSSNVHNHLHHHHHHHEVVHAKQPSLFQTPIFGME
ncbi:hypothetical protein G4B88_016486 [Cannabis sativa]|uniref:AP2/ERF domain-containing protein n=1 Tax=Cannabis sativa TaxID=3483 RepID=A0A7J6H7B5_CANSA|nr:hypothetical protein G4B88_016486 [Cannabis sativa]